MMSSCEPTMRDHEYECFLFEFFCSLDTGLCYCIVVDGFAPLPSTTTLNVVIFYAKLYMIMCEIIVTIWIFFFEHPDGTLAVQEVTSFRLPLCFLLASSSSSTFSWWSGTDFNKCRDAAELSALSHVCDCGVVWHIIFAYSFLFYFIE